MLFKTITKQRFREFISGLISENVTIGPKAVDRDVHGNPVYQFEEVHSFDEIELDYPFTYSSVKNFFLPFKENLSTFAFCRDRWEQNIEYTIHPRVIVGLRAYDISALLKLDNVLMKGEIGRASCRERV